MTHSLCEDNEVATWSMSPRSAYVHIPFCAHKCGYCDFASVAGEDERGSEYLSALEAEIETTLGSPVDVETLFVGGGTPTYLGPWFLERLLQVLVRWFQPRVGRGWEFTVESNPNTLTEEKVRLLADFGVNRISLGAQSFEPKLLVILERDHDPRSVEQAVERLLPRIPQVSIDLIFGVPGQSLEQWTSDLERALALPLAHLSAYGLMFEKGTRLWKQRESGLVRAVDDELERAMYEHLLDRSSALGWQQYEISNFARKGADGEFLTCRHNLTYWHNLPYYGFGTGAAAYVNGNRTLNSRDLGAYIRKALARESVVFQTETLEPEERARETIVLNLRLNRGLEFERFARATGFDARDLMGPARGRFESAGLLASDSERIWLTREGFLVADYVLREFL